MSNLSISNSVLSFSAPGSKTAGTSAKDNAASSRGLPRIWDDYAASISARWPDRFGLSSALGSLMGVEGPTGAVKYVLDELKADGITLFTSNDARWFGYEGSTSAMPSSSSTRAACP